MASPFGISFVPGAQDNGESNGNGRPSGPRNPVQEAIQILSLRLPKVYGARALAPSVLLNAPGGMGQPGARGNVTAEALATLAGVPSPMAPSSPAAPVVPTIPSRSEDRDRGVSRPQPQPGPQLPPIHDPQPPSAPPTPPSLGPTVVQPPRIVPGGDPVPTPPPSPTPGPPDLNEILSGLFGTRPPSGLSPRLRGGYY